MVWRNSILKEIKEELKMKIEEKIIEIEEFKIEDIRKEREDLKKKNPLLYKLTQTKEIEPFAKFFNKTFYVLIHYLEAIYFADKQWFIETRAYDDTIPVTKFIYRWIYTSSLPKELLEIIPSKALKLAKTTLFYVKEDVEILMPAMGGKVGTLLATDGKTKLYYVTNPKIFIA